MAKKKTRTKARRAKSRSQSRKINVRSAILSILGREKEVYNRHTQEYERAPLTVAEVAKLVGVHPSTLRRWKNQGVTPSARTRKEKSRLDKLVSAARSASAATSREIARDARKHRGMLRITKKDLPVLPVGHRRKLKKYARDARGQVVDTGNVYDSSIVNYHVRGWNFREVAALVLQAWKAGKPFQFIYEVPAGGSLPKSGRAPERRVNRLTRAGTAPVNPLDFPDEASVLSFLQRYIDLEAGDFSRRMIYVAIDDNFPEGELDEDRDEE